MMPRLLIPVFVHGVELEWRCSFLSWMLGENVEREGIGVLAVWNNI